MLPKWALSLAISRLCKGMVVLGMMLLMRTGLVSFGQGLYYCLGAYAAGTLDQFLQAAATCALMVMPPARSCSRGVVAAILGFLLANYRDIFFAMLSLAFSMILYGLLVKIVGARQHRRLQHLAYRPRRHRARPGTHRLRALCRRGGDACSVAMLALQPLPQLAPRAAGRAIRDNELRVEYMGASVRASIHLNYVIAAVLAGVGGALVATSIGHVDPETGLLDAPPANSYSSPSCSGTGNVFGAVPGRAALRDGSAASRIEYSPNTWQMVLGITMLLVIMFLPAGLWSLLVRRRQGRLTWRRFCKPKA